MNLKRVFAKRAVAVVLAGALAGMAAVPSMAQQGADKKKGAVELAPPVPPMGKSDIPYWPYITSILLLALVVGVNFIPSKRGHQD